MKEISSHELQKFNEGDEQAFSYVYRQFYRQLFFYSCKLHISPWESENLVTEAFTCLHRQVRLGNRFESIRQIGTFLFEVIRNAIIDPVRASKRRYILKKNFSLSESVQEEDVRNAMIEAETLQIVYDAIEGLPSVCRKVFKMSYLQDLSHQEIARLLKLSPQVVQKQKLHAIKLLKKSILTAAGPLVAGLLAGSLAAMLFLSGHRPPAGNMSEQILSGSVSLLYKSLFSFVFYFFLC